MKSSPLLGHRDSTLARSGETRRISRWRSGRASQSGPPKLNDASGESTRARGDDGKRSTWDEGGSLGEGGAH